MGVKISQLDPLTGGLTKYDKFEVEKNSDGKSYSATGEDIKTYIAKQNNGVFRGSISKDANEFTYEDIGVWNWSGANGAPKVGGGFCTSGIMEVITYISGEDIGANSYTMIQRLSDGPEVYQRVLLPDIHDYTEWSKLSTRNTAKILYGNNANNFNNGHVTFQSPFPTGHVPSVTATPIGTDSQYVYHIQVGNITTSGFDVYRFQSLRAGVTTTEETIVKEEPAENPVKKTTTTTIETTQGAWESSECAFNWIAICDVN